ncbi:MAG: hypothetical protein WBN40_03300 [Pseudomonadales bacterium]
MHTKPLTKTLTRSVQLATASALLSLSSTAFATVSISEMLIDAFNLGAAGAADDLQEFIEIVSDTGGVESLAGLHFIAIEGDAPGTGEGVIDVVIDLGSYSTGTNGLLVVSDGNTAWDPAADAGTSIVVPAGGFVNGDGGGDDIENGSMTFAIVSGFSGAGGDDLDTNDDGVLDVLPWTSVVDAVGWLEIGRNTELSYAVQLGGVEFDSNDLGDRAIDAYAVGPNGVGYVFAVADRDDDGNADGPYELVSFALGDDAPSEQVPLFVGDLNSLFTLTPGSANDLSIVSSGPSKNVPAMGALGIATLFAGLIALAARLRRRM